MSTTYPVAVHVKAKDSASEVIGRSARRIGRSLAGLRANATSASSAITSVGGSIREAVGRTALYGVGALGVGLVGAGVAAKNWATETLEAGDELATFAAKTGLSVEAIQEWRSAAARSDVEVGTFNSSIQTFARNMALARNGTGKLASGLTKVAKPLLEQLKATTTTEEALTLYIAAMEGIEDPAKRAALASMAFGGAGKDMALLAVTGSEGLKKMREEMRKAGVMTTEQATRMGDLDDQMIQLDQQYGTVKRTIGTAFIEALTPHLKGLAGWAVANKDVVASNVAGAVNGVGTALGSIDWDAISSGAGKVWSAVEKIGAVAKEAADNIAELWKAGEELGDKAAGTYDDLKSGIAGLVGVTAEDTGADGTPTAFGANTRVVTLEQQRRYAQKAAPALQMFGQGALADNIERDAAAIQSVRDLYRRRTEVRESGMYRDSGGLMGRFDDAMSTSRRLDQLSYGLTASPPPPPQEITVKVETAPGTTATITKQAKAPNVKAGVRRVGTGAP